MLKRLFEKSVELSVGDRQLRFKDLGEFEYALKDKTALSSMSVSALGKLSDDALVKEAEAFRAMEQRIVDALSGPNHGFEQFLKRLELDQISEDHDWRKLIGAVRSLDETSEPYKKSALLKYVAYLSAAQDIIRTIRVNRLGTVDDSEDWGPGKSGPALGRRQRMIVDLKEISGIGGASAPGDDSGFARMSKDKPVEVQFGEHQSLELMLAKYRFTLVSGQPFLLIDETGHDLKLRPGKNIIGRSTRSGVTLDGGYGAISRRHLVVEIGQNDRVRLTDVSTLGTFLPRELIGSTLH